MYNNIIIQIFYIKNNGVSHVGDAGGLMTFGRLRGMIEVDKFEFVED